MKYIDNPAPECAKLPRYTSYEEDRKAREAFEAEHKCKIIRVYQTTPPILWQELTVREANTYRWLENARFIGKHLVADRTGEQHGSGYESLCSMLDGLERGYKLALGPVKPYYIKYEVRKLNSWFRDYNTQEEVDRFLAQSPNSKMFAKPKVVEMWFETYDEAQKHLDEVWRKTPFPGIAIHQWDKREVLHDRTKDYHF